MPVYVYQCKSCGEKFEVYRNPQDEKKPLRCPDCRADNMERVYEPFETISLSESCDSCGTTQSGFG